LDNISIHVVNWIHKNPQDKYTARKKFKLDKIISINITHKTKIMTWQNNFNTYINHKTKFIIYWTKERRETTELLSWLWYVASFFTFKRKIGRYIQTNYFSVHSYAHSNNIIWRDEGSCFIESGAYVISIALIHLATVAVVSPLSA